MLCTTPAVWAQNLNGMSVYTEVPTVDDGQTSNWSSSENYSMLVDDNTSTKYGISNANPWVEFHYAQPFVPVGYNLWTANDQNGQRNPNSWVIKAKNAGDADWTTLDSVDNSDGSRLPMANDSVTRFTIQNSTAYRYFRFEANRNTGTSAFQLAELQLLYRG